MAPMKQHVRILGIDDSEFRFGDACVPVVGVLARVPSFIEAVLRTDIAVDGRDSTEKLAAMLYCSRYRDQTRLILIDGVTLGGFNVVDIETLSGDTGIPVATITRKKPDLDGMKAALQKHFDDWEERYSIISRGRLEPISIGSHSLYSRFVGIKKEELAVILKNATVAGAMPEAVRVAHLIATALARGESRGRV
jgi:hypothetical protein